MCGREVEGEGGIGRGYRCGVCSNSSGVIGVDCVVVQL